VKLSARPIDGCFLKVVVVMAVVATAAKMIEKWRVSGDQQ